MAKNLRHAINLVKTVILSASVEGDSIVIWVMQHRRKRLRYPVCGHRCACHDHGPGAGGPWTSTGQSASCGTDRYA